MNIKQLTEELKRILETEGIYTQSLILQAYKKEKEYLKQFGEDEISPDIQLFTIIDNEIIGCNYIPREKVYTYTPNENEYYLDRVRDTGDVITDYNLEPAQKLIDTWNKYKTNEAMERYLSVEPVPQSARTPGFKLVLYEGDKKVPNNLTGDDYITISLMQQKPLIEWTDQEIRETAKDFFDNITDDIRVQWY